MEKAPPGWEHYPLARGRGCPGFQSSSEKCPGYQLPAHTAPGLFPYHDLLVVVGDVGVVGPGCLGVGVPHCLGRAVVLRQERFSLCFICYFV